MRCLGDVLQRMMREIHTKVHATQNFLEDDVLFTQVIIEVLISVDWKWIKKSFHGKKLLGVGFDCEENFFKKSESISGVKINRKFRNYSLSVSFLEQNLIVSSFSSLAVVSSLATTLSFDFKLIEPIFQKLVNFQ